MICTERHLQNILNRFLGMGPFIRGPFPKPLKRQILKSVFGMASPCGEGLLLNLIKEVTKTLTF